jgi:hypothetical protein
LEAHHERTKRNTPANPDIDTERSKYNFLMVKPQKSYLQETNSRIEAAAVKPPKDSVRFVDTLSRPAPTSSKARSRGFQKAFPMALISLQEDRQGQYNLPHVHMDEKKRLTCIYA